MTMNYYFTQGAIIAVIVNVLLFAAWHFARMAEKEHRILNNEEEELSRQLHEYEPKAETGPVPQETTEATDRDDAEQVRSSSLKRDWDRVRKRLAELQYDKHKIRSSFLGSNYCDFGAMFFSAILL
jgi:hypothetical protein